ncbi:hypothetical protein Baya_15513 [Bagarius yarrelli]|uniref:Uncharacterized protein n=1 Tax=Bagarius yarrelli TaxID=175774 RepID=A0A556VBY3_BAGYA|nr:hypothetical protein Baya_15513 [Bagarius yarrelli]
MLILKQHYQDTLVEELSQIQVPSQSWEEYFQTATVWANRILGRRLKDKSVQEAYTLIKRKCHLPVPTTNPDVVEEETVIHDVHLPPPSPPVIKRSSDTVVQVMVHATRKETQTASTMTEPPNDWSPFRQSEAEAVKAVDFPPSPKNKRTSRVRFNPAVIEEKDLVLVEEQGEDELSEAEQSENEEEEQVHSVARRGTPSPEK